MTNPTPLAWHNRPDLKAEVVARMRTHRDADEFIQCLYQEINPDVPSGYRGCALGCMLPPQTALNSIHWSPIPTPPGGWFATIEHEFGIHYKVARLIDAIFTSMRPGQCAAFAVAVVEAVPVGADLTPVADAWPATQMYDADPARQARWLLEHLETAANPEQVEYAIH